MSSQLFRIDCGYQNYDWGKIGSSSAVAQYAAASNPATAVDESKPYAELWMGTHPSVPSVKVATKETLRDLVTAKPDALLGPGVVSKFGAELPFLFKVLSIRKVLSIQAHPDKAGAKVLHEADPKNYPDDNHKPEMAIAVTAFEGFCGFKPLEEISVSMDRFPEFAAVVGPTLQAKFQQGVQAAAVGSAADAANRKLLQEVFGTLMRTEEATIKTLAASLVARARATPELFYPRQADLILRLNEQFPNDIGLFCGCIMLNHCELKAGEAMFLEAKDPHAYISGDIIECMAASDNVVRAGFTPKFKDVENLVDMLTYAYGSVEKQKMVPLAFPRASGDGKSVLYDPPIAEFAVLQTVLNGGVERFDKFDGPSIVLATKGAGQIGIKGGVFEEIKAGFVYFVAPGVELELRGTEGEFITYRAFVE